VRVGSQIAQSIVSLAQCRRILPNRRVAVNPLLAFPAGIAGGIVGGPMRYFLLDRILTLRPPESATAVKCVSLADDVFSDHFPGHPVMPGALLIEGMAQLGGVLVEATMRARGHDHLHSLLTMVDRAKFRELVRPGDRVELEAIGLAAREEGGQVRGLARVEGKMVAEAELTFALFQVTNPKLIQRRREALQIWLGGSVGE
jgi:3-hydroxymyristoyl/3-hydroxydecanoyl-(acyl carrier protein) dehydratase